MSKTLFKISLMAFMIGLISGCAPKSKEKVHIWDISIPWGSAVFHTQNAIEFAHVVKKRSNGRLIINIHPGAILGIKGPESMRAIGEGIVDGGEMALLQQTGLEPILGLSALPFLVKDQTELALLFEDMMPVIERRMAARNLKPLYMVPWPNQNIYTKRAVSSLTDLKGLTIRTYDAHSSEMMERLGMAPMQMTSADVVLKLATGELDSTMTSTTTGAAQKYWEFVSHIYRTNHIWATNLVAVNMDRFKALEPDLQTIVTNTAIEMQHGFWVKSVADDQLKLKVLESHGIKTIIPSKKFITDMKQAAAPMINAFVKHNPDAQEILDSFYKKLKAGENKKYNFKTGSEQPESCGD